MWQRMGWIVGVMAFGCGCLGSSPANPPPVEPVDVARETYDMRPGCTAFVEHVNGLDCVPASARLKSELVCTPPLGEAACDATAFWECATRLTTCEKGRLIRADPDACPDPCGPAIAGVQGG